ncbi:MAG: ABC transporter permease [Bacteroidota bacterium]
MLHKPPKFALKLLRWYCNPAILEEIEGDATELFLRRISSDGNRKAKVRFIWDVLRFFRWSNIKRTTTQKQHINNTAMILNYFKTGLRSLSKDKVTSTINIVGLALAIGCAVTTFIFVDFFLSMDTFHSKRHTTYQIISHVTNNGEKQMWSDAPILLGPEMKDEIPFIDLMTRIEFGSGNMRYNDLVFNEGIEFVDPDYLKMFDFPIKYGRRNALDNKENIFISKKVADKYFPQDDPIGKQVSIKYDNGFIASYFIGGVFDKAPDLASFNPRILISMESFFEVNHDKSYDWSYYADGVFVSLKPGHDPDELERFFPEWIVNQNNSNPQFRTNGFEAMMLTDLSKRNHEILSSIAGGGHPAGRISLTVISIMLMLLACSNYVNIAVSSATKRLKEIGLRKALGGTRKNIIRQFLIENIITCFLAVLLGTFLSFVVFMPGFNAVIPITIPFEFSSLLSMSLFFTGILFLVGLVSGAYPAFFISKFQPVHIFRGGEKFGRKSLFSKILLTLQFMIAFSTIVGSFIFTDTSIQLANKDLGYTPEGVVTIPIKNAQEYNGLKNKALQHSDIHAVSGSKGQIGLYDRLTTIKYEDNDLQVNLYLTDEAYLKTMGLRLTDGRYFNKGADVDKAVINQRLLSEMGWDDPLNHHFIFEGKRYDVIGVVEDFQLDDFYFEIRPTMFLAIKDENFNYLTVKTSLIKEVEINNYMRDTWRELAPDDPYEGVYQSQIMDDFYRENRSNIYIIIFISGLTLVLACIGLYGLIAYNISKRLKEFSVRRVLGANLFSITQNINKDYIWILIIAFVLGAPLGMIQMTQLIKSIYPEAPGATLWPYVIAMLIMFISLGVTILSQVRRVAKSNPASVLRSE